ncbi:glycosyltransferase [Methylobacterium sp. Leaf399]|uniref:glycosyltransferase n=1 Tax=Methylobacterium sp. Leaf399 TaxID=1736364 RepID=UPI000A892646|nr:glycosyltransferase [Methylobacterium sp. Leaf399]
MTLPYSFARAYDGRALVISDLNGFSDTYSIQAGNSIYPLHPTKENLPRLLTGGNVLLNHDFSNGVDNWIAPAALPPTVNFGTDFSEDTRLVEMSAAYLTGSTASPSFSVVYRDPLFGEDIPIDAGRMYGFTGFFAAHRALARVEVAFLNADQHVIDVVSSTVNEHLGGPDRENWQFVDLRGQAPAGAETLRLGIRFLRHHNGVRGMNFFVFFTDLGLRIGNQPTSGDGGGLEDGWTRNLLAVIGGQSDAKVYQAELDLDQINSERSTVYLVANHQSQAEQAVVYDAISMQDQSKAALTILGGRTLRVNLDGVSNCSLYCDGLRLDGLVSWGEISERYFVLPERLLDGQVHLFDVRDFAGIAFLYRDYQFVPCHVTPWHILQEHTAPRLPTHLAPAAADRYRALQAHLRHGMDATFQGRLHHVHGVVVQGFDFNKNFAEIEFPRHADPQVTIVIPVHNKFEVTYFCLCALLLAHNKTSYEVVVVDDGSKDRTLKLDAVAKGITIVRNEIGLGFIGACNRGALEARGKYVLFLNNDTEPTVGWLDELLASFDLFDTVGLAGSKLVYPDGSLQEAGGIVWGSGNPWNYGRSQNPHEPRYSYTRQADYLSGAAIMLPLAVWNEVGGFSEEFKPAYFEDTDLAFKVRKHGYKTLYVATSVVYHFEGVTGGTDVSSGAKKNQEINRPKFKSKWVSDYRKNGREGETPDLEKDRGIIGRVLFIDFQTPKLDTDAGSYAAIQEMKMVQALGYKVSFLPQNLAYLGRHTETLQRLGIETYYAPFYQSISEVLERHGREFDAIYMTRYYVASHCVELARRLAPQAKLIMNNADLHFLRELRAGINLGDRAQVDRALQVRDDELAVMRDVDLTLSYNGVEHAVIMSHNLDSTRVMYVPWVEKIATSVAPFEGRSGVAFLGGFNHHPNREAVAFFVKSVMPRLRNLSPAMDFNVYGSNVSPDVTALAAKDVVIQGYVEDVSEVYDHCLVFVAPLTSGAGIKGKVLGALAHGVPCVLSPLAAEGIGLRHGYDCLIVDDPADWADAVTRLSKDKDLWTLMSQRGQDLIRSTYSFELGVKTMRKAFEAVGLYMP